MPREYKRKGKMIQQLKHKGKKRQNRTEDPNKTKTNANKKANKTATESQYKGKGNRNKNQEENKQKKTQTCKQPPKHNKYSRKCLTRPHYPTGKNSTTDNALTSLDDHLQLKVSIQASQGHKPFCFFPHI